MQSSRLPIIRWYVCLFILLNVFCVDWIATYVLYSTSWLCITYGAIHQRRLQTQKCLRFVVRIGVRHTPPPRTFGSQNISRCGRLRYDPDVRAWGEGGVIQIDFGQVGILDRVQKSLFGRTSLMDDPSLIRLSSILVSSLANNYSYISQTSPGHHSIHSRP